MSDVLADSALRKRAARLARSPYGTALAAGWGFAEAKKQIARMLEEPAHV
ncbi:hypothetical protein O4J56_02640 [Nocardiopsis sp. RSe5-2]|uniref:Uncharacterized protein n=1 Tax=Nocardiopsis endophytica TaxID=3018445 RepID=A0ABT4TYP4_9ACTN|nr:hypothetical protein [Nocardiopsis endophytica]MDA2809526.1 hypothetical protein [Nocardiopsis endophytica]